MKHLMPALKMLVAMTLLTGIVYPLLITVVSGAAFDFQSGGSLVFRDGKPIGSLLLAQKFVNPKYFWPRPSSVDFNPIPSGASNLGPTSADLKKQIEDRVTKGQGMPQDLLTASGSGLDPEISPEAAHFQVSRVAKARQWGPDGETKLSALVDSLTKKRDFGVLGEPRVNVLELNLALDR